MDLSFFSSSEGIAIAWLCTVLGCGYAIFQQVQVYCWDAKNLATECIHTWPADAL